MPAQQNPSWTPELLVLFVEPWAEFSPCWCFFVWPSELVRSSLTWRRQLRIDLHLLFLIKHIYHSLICWFCTNLNQLQLFLCLNQLPTPRMIWTTLSSWWCTRQHWAKHTGKRKSKGERCKRWAFLVFVVNWFFRNLNVGASSCQCWARSSCRRPTRWRWERWPTWPAGRR